MTDPRPPHPAPTPIHPTHRALLSVPEFCRSHGIARSHFYVLLKEGRGPRITKLGRRTLISIEAAADWRRAMERETARAAAD